jgi:formylglycine-generating enzyme required for sulfatase activity
MQSKRVSVWVLALIVAAWTAGCISDGGGGIRDIPHGAEDAPTDAGDLAGTSGADGTNSGGDVVTLPDGGTCTTDCSAGCGVDDGCGGVCGCSIGFECEDNQCVERTVTCIKLDKSNHTLYPPAGLRVVFRVTDCDGYPIRKLTPQDVQIINDAKGEPFGAGGEGGGASAPSTPSEYGLYSMLVLDMSDSIFNASAVDQVLDGALLFVQKAVEQAPAGLKQNVGIMVFGRTAGTRVVQDFTADHALLYQQIDALRSGQSLGTTNLYGAYTMAIEEVLNQGVGLELAERAVVILTDGTHEAGDEENQRALALSAKDGGELDGSLTVFSIGIRGNYDESKIRELASRPEYFRIAEDASALSTIFDEFAARTKAIAESNYAVGVCTPIELGNASLTVKVQVSGASTEQKVNYNADKPGSDLTGDVATCDPSLIADPCDSRVCGSGALPGSQCGTCSSASEICTTAGQCQDDCAGLACGNSPQLGISCGTCAGTTSCEANQCVDADCAGRQCGMSPQGFDCGFCTGAAEYCSSNQCVNDCAGRQCGTSPRGFECGACTGLTACNASGQCVNDCAILACGTSPLGANCGTCPATAYCGSGGQCVTAPATGTQQVFSAGAGAYRFIRPGTFTMGSPTDELGRVSSEVQHGVTLTRGFWLKETEVTQGEWQAVMGNNPSYFSSCGTNCPVDFVSWWDAVTYCNALSLNQGLTACYTLTGCSGTPGVAGYTCSSVARVSGCAGYRLPTEAEWEYAYRAGTTTALYNGPITRPSGTDPYLELIGWYTRNSSYQTHPVAGKAANTWGLYDMAGNLWEWTWDRYGDYSSAPQNDPSGPTNGADRVIRGGAWLYNAQSCRAAQRFFSAPADQSDNIGFRPVRSF